MEKQFSECVADYYENRNIYPATLTFKNTQVDQKFLDKLEQAVHSQFADENIEIIRLEQVNGDFWSGVLIEFDKDSYPDVDATDFDAMQNNETLISQLSKLYKRFDTYGTQAIGLSTGESVYAVSCLESLGESFFE